LDLGEKRSRRSIIDIRDAGEITPLLHLHPPQDEYLAIPTTEPSISRNRRRKRRKEIECLQGLSQAPAILLACLLNLMIGIPFGVSYFPVGWQDFPVQNRVAMGLRMFLFSTVIGQIVLTFTSKFKNPIALQMVENVPFYHALAYICIEEQGMGTEALSTLIVLFGLSSLLVGGVFYLLGKLEYGRVVYFFPTHVLVGCIGGIGIFISITALEVTIDADLKVLDPSSWTALWTDWYLVIVVFGLEVFLRLLDWATHDSSGRPRFPLLAPVYFCLVTPFFYLALWIFRIPVSAAQEAGYFFPAAAEACTDAQNCASGGESSSSLFDDLWVEWGILDLSSVSPSVIVKSIPTLIALAAFSLIHVPINIPAFAISTDVDTDMNAELIAHGWSNALAGVVGGLQNYMSEF
jgi:SulP family sulfate permease